MIEQLFYTTGAIFFSLVSFMIVRCYFAYNKMASITIPEMPQSVDTMSRYRQRLIEARVKTEDDLCKMSDEDVKKLYLKHEQSIIDDMSDQVSKLFVKGWTKSVARVLPVDEAELESDLNRDVFVKVAVNEFFPSLYYRYGKFLAPVSVLATTASHIDYKQIGSSHEINGDSQDNQEHQEVKSDQDPLGTADQ
jgi:hypothetical protein